MGVAADSASESRKQFMRNALKMAERGMAAGGPPVGACLVIDGAVVHSAANAVVGELDSTAHAEITVIREACKKLRTLDLSGASLYVTVEPCAMCLSACYYAGISEICFGAPIEAMEAKTGDELCADPAALFASSVRKPVVTGGLLAGDCAALLAKWQPVGGKRKS